MSVSTSSSPAQSHSVVPIYAPRLLNVVALFLVRRRILLSGIVFGALIATNVLLGGKPRDIANLRDPVSVAGCMLVLGGLALRSWAVGILRKNKELTTSGPYRLIRNPLYVGSFLMMFGFCTLMANPWNFAVVLGPVLAIYIVKVRQEEQWLAGLFPDEWPTYSKSTPRFFPRLAWPHASGPWRLAQWVRSREYEGVGATLAALMAIKLWQMIE